MKEGSMYGTSLVKK